MATFFEKTIRGKPSLDELCDNIRIVDKWYQLGIQLKLDCKKLKVIELLQGDDSYKTAKMFELWLDSNPHATRKQVIDALRKEVIEENTIAHEYEDALRKDYIPLPAGEYYIQTYVYIYTHRTDELVIFYLFIIEMILQLLKQAPYYCVILIHYYNV